MIIKVNIETCLKNLLLQEDTDNDKRITIDDKGPKAFKVETSTGESYIVKGTYHLSNLLQELVIAKNEGLVIAEIPLSKIEELPVSRISRIIKDYFWKGLTRTMDEAGVENLIHDTKNETLTSNKLRVYIPFNDLAALNIIRILKMNYQLKPFYCQSTLHLSLLNL